MASFGVMEEGMRRATMAIPTRTTRVPAALGRHASTHTAEMDMFSKGTVVVILTTRWRRATMAVTTQQIVVHRAPRGRVKRQDAEMGSFTGTKRISMSATTLAILAQTGLPVARLPDPTHVDASDHWLQETDLWKPVRLRPQPQRPCQELSSFEQSECFDKLALLTRNTCAPLF